MPEKDVTIKATFTKNDTQYSLSAGTQTGGAFAFQGDSDGAPDGVTINTALAGSKVWLVTSGLSDPNNTMVTYTVTKDGGGTVDTVQTSGQKNNVFNYYFIMPADEVTVDAEWKAFTVSGSVTGGDFTKVDVGGGRMAGGLILFVDRDAKPTVEEVRTYAATSSWPAELISRANIETDGTYTADQWSKTAFSTWILVVTAADEKMYISNDKVTLNETLNIDLKSGYTSASLSS
jgi:hypothetical protein